MASRPHTSARARSIFGSDWQAPRQPEQELVRGAVRGPIPSPILCSAIEAELIGEANDAGVVEVVANVATEARHRGVEDVHIEPAMEKIREALQLVLGNDIFTPRDEEPSHVDPPIDRPPRLSREGVVARSTRDRGRRTIPPTRHTAT